MLLLRRQVYSHSKRLYSQRAFPKTFAELQESVKTCLTSEGGLASQSHPSLLDKEYVQRRNQVAAVSSKYAFEDSRLPFIEYTQQEKAIWYLLYPELLKIQIACAPEAVSHNFNIITKELKLSPNDIPQLDDLSKFQERSQGWKLRPVVGLLTLEQFLNQLAFKVWPATQYIRHFSGILYSHEPDFIHELFGHQATLMIPEASKTLQNIGLASLGASQDEMEQLAALYWYTFEIGMCKEQGQQKLLGGALMTSHTESNFALSSNAKILDFSIEQITQHYTKTIQYSGIQPFYFNCPPIKEMCNEIDNFTQAILKKKKSIPYYCEETKTIKLQ